MLIDKMVVEILGGANKSAVKWDIRFLQMAKFISSYSKDSSTKVGAVIIENKNEIVSLGFNGFAQKMQDADAMYADRELKYSRVIHAEINAFIFARRPVKGCTVYTWPLPPCDRCAVQLIQAGITRCVWQSPSEELKSRWGDSLYKSKVYMSEAGVVGDEYSEELVDVQF